MTTWHGDEAPGVGSTDSFPRDLILAQLEKILSSPDFARARRMKRFLRFVVEETLEGRARGLKEYTIAVEVFERGEAFDPTTSALVRVEAGRLRRILKQYYLTYGRDDSILIDVPRGGYVPRFSAGAQNDVPGGLGDDPSAESLATDAPAANPGKRFAVQPTGSRQPERHSSERGPATVLVVDDEPQVEALISQRFRHRVRNGSLSFLFASNGEEALDVLLSNADIDMVLTDINMPRMDGLSLLDHLDQIDPMLVAVVVSAYGDMENIRIAMNRGAFDFITKPINFTDLSRTIDKTLAHRAILRDAAMEHDQLEALRKELAIASRIQQSFRPVELPTSQGYSLAGRTRPAREVGGDFFDYFPVDHDRIAVVIGEVSGRGVPAAFGAAICRAVMRTTALTGLSPADCVDKANAVLCVQGGSALTATLFVALFDPAAGSLECVNAGHKLPYVLNADREPMVFEGVVGPRVGARPDASFETCELRLSPHDGLFLFTDGVTNAFNHDRQQFSIQRLEEGLSADQRLPADKLVDEVMAVVDAFVGGADYEDDVTCLALMRHEPG